MGGFGVTPLRGRSQGSVGSRGPFFLKSDLQFLNLVLQLCHQFGAGQALGEIQAKRINCRDQGYGKQNPRRPRGLVDPSNGNFEGPRIEVFVMNLDRQNLVMLTGFSHLNSR